MSPSKQCISVRAITSGAHHFFGYYDKFPWDVTSRYHLVQRVGFMDRMPEPDDRAAVGMVDTADGNRFIPLDETTAWCWQQGTMLQWLGSAPDREIVYNIREDGAFKARVRDVQTGRARTLPRPVYALTADGARAGTLSFSRVHDVRPGYGYCGLRDPNFDVMAPEDDGVWVMDMRSGEARLIVSLAALAAIRPPASFAGAKHRVKHFCWNPAGTRLLFLHRWADPVKIWPWGTRMFTVNPDGSDLFLVHDSEMTSHFDWRDNDHILAWTRWNGQRHFHLFRDMTDSVEIVGAEVMNVDGHCSYSPDRRWILNDTYPEGDPPCRVLYLYRVADGRRFDLGRFLTQDPNKIYGPIRCDLHPRWSRDGRQVSFDSVHEGARQVYVMDVSAVAHDKEGCRP